MLDYKFVAAAKRLYTDEGTLEVDDGAVVSRGDDEGAYVAAWVWVENAEARKEVTRKAARLESHKKNCAQRHSGECTCGVFEHNQRVYGEGGQS